MNKILLIFLTLSFNLAQSQQTDETILGMNYSSSVEWTAKQNNIYANNKDTMITPKLGSGFSHHHDHKFISIRIGGLLQKGYCGEFGIAKQIVPNGISFSSSVYTSIEWTPAEQNDIYGLKVGYEETFTIFSFGLEAKYLSNFSNEKDFMITPKIGLHHSVINIFYGYNISMNRSPFPEIGRHQLSIVLNIPIIRKKVPRVLRRDNKYLLWTPK